MGISLVRSDPVGNRLENLFADIGLVNATHRNLVVDDRNRGHHAAHIGIFYSLHCFYESLTIDFTHLVGALHGLDEYLAGKKALHVRGRPVGLLRMMLGIPALIFFMIGTSSS